MSRFHIVEICHSADPEAKKLREANIKLGYWVYFFRGYYVLILGGE